MLLSWLFFIPGNIMSSSQIVSSRLLPLLSYSIFCHHLSSQIVSVVTQMASSRSSSSHTVGRRLGERCRCGDEVIILTSWTEQNYGRRFVKCPNYKSPWGYNYFDGPFDNPISEEMKKLKEENGEFRRRLKFVERALYIVAAVNLYLICKVVNFSV